MESLRYFALIGDKINRIKTIHAFMKREGIEFEKTREYLNITNEEIKSKYIIKGEINWKTIEKAKKVGSEMSEHDIQVKVCKWLKERKICHFAVPNGFVHNGDKVSTADKISTAQYINYMKAEGLYPGVPDLVILPGNGKVAFLELKTEKGHPSEFQLKWQKHLQENKYMTRICYGYESAIKYLEEILI